MSNFFDKAGVINNPVLLEHMLNITYSASLAVKYMENSGATVTEINAVEAIFTRQVSEVFFMTSALLGIQNKNREEKKKW